MVLSSIADVKKAGPLVEYERRIAAGELVDGDACQVRKTTSGCILYQFHMDK